jgi:hypothetical protein
LDGVQGFDNRERCGAVGTEYEQELIDVRTRLADFVDCETDDLVLVPNATSGPDIDQLLLVFDAHEPVGGRVAAGLDGVQGFDNRERSTGASRRAGST